MLGYLQEMKASRTPNHEIQRVLRVSRTQVERLVREHRIDPFGEILPGDDGVMKVPMQVWRQLLAMLPRVDTYNVASEVRGAVRAAATARAHSSRRVR